MDPRKQRIEAVFDQAVELTSPAERAAYLSQACDGDPDLRQEIEELLQADERAGGFLAATLSEGGALPQTHTQPSPNEQPGCVIGRYKLREKIGEGGFGIVYLAEQQEPVKRRVALKIIKLGMDTRQVVARFEAERQALALMDHPNIAKVHDGGATDTGRLYFVMELVRGVPITHYCDENHLPTCERLRLFVQVCQAVQHAHQKGIIHRDLKPSNILVTVNDGLPVPKVIDFGVAKATQQELTEKTIVTQFHHFIGTPAYMSPEQAEMTSLDIDTRSDIYALGVLLYELLTGKTPFDGKELLGSGLDAMRTTIREKEPPRPSTRLSTMAEADRTTTARLRKSEPPQLITLLRGDLDWIVMKALEKDRNRRYETANGLAADIKRHLDNEPVIARPPSTAYRLQKFIRRNKLQFAAAAFAVTVMILAVVVSSWQAVRASRERQVAKEQAKIAKEQAEIARSVKDFLTQQLLGTVNPFIDPQPSAYKLPLLAGIAQQLEGQFPDQPLIEAEIRYALGDAFKEIGEWAKSAAQFEKCLELRRRALTLNHSDTLEVVAWLAEDYIYLGRRFAAQKLLTEAMAVVRSSPQVLSRGAGWVLFEQGYVLFRDHRFAEALPYMKEALTVLKPARGPISRHWDSRLADNSLLEVLPLVTGLVGQWDEADRMIAEELKECERDHGADVPLTALLQRMQADMFLARGRWQEALPILERSVPIHRRVLGTNHFSTTEAEFVLGWAYEQKGDLENAAKLYVSLPQRWAKYFPYDLARLQCARIAQFFVRQQRIEEAKAVYETLRESFKANPPEWSSEPEIYFEAVAATKGSDAVEAVYRQLLANQPENADLLRRQAESARRGRWKESAADAAKVVEGEPNKARALIEGARVKP